MDQLVVGEGVIKKKEEFEERFEKKLEMLNKDLDKEFEEKAIWREKYMTKLEKEAAFKKRRKRRRRERRRSDCIFTHALLLIKFDLYF